MRRATVIAVCGLGTVLVLGAAWRLWDNTTLGNPDRIAKETGLALPPDAKIIASQSGRPVLCDGPNYAWLIESKTDMTAWIEANMHREDGWKDVKAFGEVAPLARGPLSRVSLDSVWESVYTMPDGRTEEAFLYLAEGRTAAILTTFRP